MAVPRLSPQGDEPRSSVREYHPPSNFPEIPLSSRRRVDKLTVKQRDEVSKLKPLALNVIHWVEGLAASSEACDNFECLTQLLQSLNSLGPDGPLVLIGLEILPSLATAVFHLPVAHTSLSSVIQILRLLINDPKKCCGDDVIQPQLILACGDVLKRCGSAKFDSSTDIDAVDAVAALVIDVLEVVTGIARVNQPAVSLGGVFTGISAVLDRVCVCVGVSVSPSSSSIESQPFEGLDDDGAASHSVGIEASPTYFGSIIESILQCISVLARGNARGKELLLSSTVTSSLFRVLTLFCPAPPEVESGAHMPSRQLPPLLQCPFGLQLTLTCHDVIQSFPAAAVIASESLHTDGTAFALFELWNVQRLLGAIVTAADAGQVSLAAPPESLDIWAWEDTPSYQFVSDSDPQSRYLCLAMLVSGISASQPEFGSAVSTVLKNPLIRSVWSWPTWGRLPSSSPRAKMPCIPEYHVPSLKEYGERYISVLEACDDALEDHHDDDTVAESLSKLEGLVTLQTSPDPSPGSTVPVMLSPLALSTPVPLVSDISASTANLLPPSAFSYSASVFMSSSSIGLNRGGPSGKFPTLSQLQEDGGAGKPLEDDVDEAANPPASHLASYAIFSAFCVFHAHPGIAVIVSGLQNIAPSVMLVANNTLACVLAAFPAGRAVLQSVGGLEALAECLYDYDTDIRRSALQCASLLASPSPRPSLLPYGSDLILTGVPDVSHPHGSRIHPPPHFDLSDALRTCGVLPHVLRIVAQWPCADVTDDVATAAVWVLAHATSGNSDNQSYLGELGACEALVRSLVRCLLSDVPVTDTDRLSNRARVLEAVVTALGNLTVNHGDNQCRLARNGGLSTLVRVLCATFVHPAFTVAVTSRAVLAHVESKTEESETTPLTTRVLNPPILEPDVSSPEACGATVSAQFDPATLSLWMFSSIQAQTSISIVNSMLIALLNIVAGNPTAQSLCDSAHIEALIQRLLAKPVAPDAREGLTVQSCSYRKHGCMLLSHLVGNHATNQRRFVTATTLKLLCDILQDVMPMIDDEAVAMSVALRPFSQSEKIAATVADPAEAIQEYVGDALGMGDETPFPGLSIHTELDVAQPDADDITSSAALARAVEESELRVAALTCLVNVTYRNSEAQALAASFGAIKTVISYLPLSDCNVTKAAAFCLGNLVRGSEENGAALVGLGGVEALIDVINDVHDDDASKKAFATLTHCGVAAVHRLLASVEAAAFMFPSRHGFPDAVMSKLQRLKGEEYHRERFLTSSHALAWLDKCLPVLNGLLITRPENKRWLLQSGDAVTLPPSQRWLAGMWPFVALFAVDIPDEIALYAGIVLANLTSGPHTQLQSVVCGHVELLEALVAACLWFDSNFSPTEVDGMTPEGTSITLNILTNVIVGQPALTSALVDCQPLVATVEKHVHGGSAEATELLLLLAERIADDRQLSKLAGEEVARKPRKLTDWADVCPSNSCDAIIDQLCKGLTAIQAAADHKSVTFLRAEQCLLGLQDRGGQRGTGLALWK